MDNLKSCPFCGGKAKLEDMGFPHHVFCTECGARVTGRGFAEDGEKDAILKWNRRIETVRCKDCRFAHLTYDGMCKQCEKATDDEDNMLTLYLPGDFFCGYGEMKEGDGDG